MRPDGLVVKVLAQRGTQRMDRSIETVEAEAMRLSAEERAALVGRLIETLEPFEPGTGWRTTIERHFGDEQARNTTSSYDGSVPLVERLRLAGF